MRVRNSIISLLSLGTFFLSGCGGVHSDTWDIDSLDKIGGHDIVVNGNPEVVETEIGAAVKFDGDGDMILVDYNPIGVAKAFTVEVLFKPLATYPENIAPRFIHIQDPDDPDQKRLMIELRINENNQCYLDGFLHTDSMSLVLIDENLVHPTEQWNHAAVTFENGVMTTWFNGEKELSGQLGYAETLINPLGKVAIGGRMDHRNWFNGYIKTLKVTHEVLTPDEFLQVPI
jgi:hypothetical protein